MSLPVSAGEEEGTGSCGLGEVSGEDSPVIEEGSWGGSVWRDRKYY